MWSAIKYLDPSPKSLMNTETLQPMPPTLRATWPGRRFNCPFFCLPALGPCTLCTLPSLCTENKIHEQSLTLLPRVDLAIAPMWIILHTAKLSNIEVGPYLNRPVVFTDFSIWVSAWSASLLLDMKSDFPTPSAKGMGLITPFTKRTGSLGLK